MENIENNIVINEYPGISISLNQNGINIKNIINQDKN
jgi:hypothetical protein